MLENVIIGSGFSSLGAALALADKKKSFTVICGSVPKNENYLYNRIKLPSRNFKKYIKNINFSYKINKIVTQKNHNFITYLGVGGLSNLWGKILNTDIKIEKKKINFICKRLNIKKNKIIFKYSNMILCLFQESKLNPFNVLNSLKNKNLIKTGFVEEIFFDKKKNFFNIKLSNKKKFLKCKKIYLASGLFTTIRIIKNLLGKNFLNRPLKLLHNNMSYGLFISKKVNVKHLTLSKKNSKNLNYFFLEKKNIYAGRVSLINNNLIGNYKLNFTLIFADKILNLFGYKIFLFNFLYKNKKNNSKIYFDKDHLVVNSKEVFGEEKIINNFFFDLKKYFKFSFIFSVKTPVGSDFHYSSNILYNVIKSRENINLCKNIYITDSAFLKKQFFFPTFYLILNAYFTIKNNYNLNYFLNQK